jgi:hypothetical protein
MGRTKPSADDRVIWAANPVSKYRLLYLFGLLGVVFLGGNLGLALGLLERLRKQERSHTAKIGCLGGWLEDAERGQDINGSRGLDEGEGEGRSQQLGTL